MNENDKKEKIKKTDEVDFLVWIIMATAIGVVAGFADYTTEMSIFISVTILLCALKTGFDAIIKAIKESK